MPFEEDSPESPAYPSVQSPVRSLEGAMFEVFKPAPQGTVHVSDNDLKTVSVRTSGLASDRFPEFVDTLLSGHPSAFAEEISQELEASAIRVGDVRLIRVELQVGLCHPRPSPS